MHIKPIPALLLGLAVSGAAQAASPIGGFQFTVYGGFDSAGSVSIIDLRGVWPERLIPAFTRCHRRSG